MSVSTKFETFCKNIRIEEDVVSKISYRYGQITSRLNTDFWNTDSKTSHSLYVGSYGRDTDVKTSDIDILMQLPWDTYHQYDNHSDNGQSALIQAVRDSLKKTYSTSHVRGDGQVVQIKFEDDIDFEIVPGFLYTDGTFAYPDTNNGGSWRVTNPKPEIEEIRETNTETNGNLKNLCRMARIWNVQWNDPMGGLLIDTLAYQFIKQWEYRDKSYLYYDYMTRDFFEFVKDQDSDQEYWRAVGSGQYVKKNSDFTYKALRCFNLANEAIAHEEAHEEYSANAKWREIYGSKF